MGKAQDFSSFITALMNGPSEADLDLDGPQYYTPAVAPPRASRPVPETSQQKVAALRALVDDLGRTSDAAKRPAILMQIISGVGWLRARARDPAFLPMWQVAFALEGLLIQLANKPSHITSSRLRTVASTLDLFDFLSESSPNPKIASEPPVKLLAVDDDAVCRFALSVALKKAFGAPDLAVEGQSALELATTQPYDAIFLDIQMPGMDGFELCTKIHQTTANRDTPVVFVTSQSDFETRAKSAAVGANELIAKPFFAFEVALKALSLVLKGRIEAAQRQNEEDTVLEKPVELRAQPDEIEPEPYVLNIGNGPQPALCKGL